MTPQQVDRVRRILRLAVRLPAEERDEYLNAVTEKDPEVRAAVERLLTRDMSLEQTLRERRVRRPAELH
jgi:hypothetical protein